ncbi:DNA dependent ATPase DNA helicase B [Fusarium heterosporum]|uniref:DNA dependent ATPase DNA helicase B n=1 Tax=Fusarium heterosporum TaxID=42747 RepID=A0A8H5WHB2_FUSHE|nr:DNA dependent ATPase DNA helicase B [Fusarium heterosporum]
MWRGERRGGREGSRPPRPRDVSSNFESTKLCFNFQNGSCKFGNRCKFYHDANNSGEQRARPTFRIQDSESREDYYEWKHLLRKSPQDLAEPGSFQHATNLWKGALEILDGGSQEQHQLVARELVDDKFYGPEWITFTSKYTTFQGRTQLQCAMSILQVITHESIKPLSIDPFVGTMYILLGGPNGEAGIALLSRMCWKLLSANDVQDASLELNLRSTIDVILKTLLELLNKIQRAQFSDQIPDLIRSLDDLVATVTENCSKSGLDGLETRLNIIKRVIAGSAGRITMTKSPSSNERRKAQTATSSFPKVATLPGGRHDNDFSDISDISILPTQGEITSEHAEYLPSTNFLHHHVLEDSMQRYVDSTFRLVRHDTMGPINDVLRDLLASGDVMTSRLSDKNSQAQVYQSAKISRIFVDDKKGLEVIVSLQPPAYILRKSPADQRDWWQRSPRLAEGSLLCFVVSEAEGPSQRLLFLQVTCKSTQGDSDRPDARTSTLVSQRSRPSITTRLATQKQCDLTLLVRLSQNNITGVLVDFNGIIPETFTPILKNLQRIKRENHIAFQNWILPTHEGNNDMPPPLYARKPGFVFPLSCISKDGHRSIELDPTTAMENINMQEIEESTGLDHGQCLGLVGALTREYALIQGPPGTGKSYLGVQLVRTLLGVKEQADLGPILIICFTNHALDQFLKHLLDVGINAIIRIGGRSVAEELDGKNLRTVSRETRKTRVETQILGQAYGEQKVSLKAAESALGLLHQARKGPSWEGLKRHLLEDYPMVYPQLRRVDDEGFQTVSKDSLKAWLGTRPASTSDWQTSVEDSIALAQKNIHGLSPAERWDLADHWLEELQDKQSGMLYESLEDFDEKRKTIHRTHDAVDQRTLTRADVIGITTTSLAGRIDMLKSLTLKVVMCEEAAELKESDVISALKAGVEHFIQIGDHRQLRPQINNYDLSLESPSAQFWQLDRSQFERRAVGEPGLAPAPFAQLNVQRRMRPEISQLIRRVYPNLEDHPTVSHHEDVVGMRKNLFWLDHNHPEDTGGDGTRVKSHSNTWETNMATALVRHLIRQGVYRAEDIALLTPYTGQLQQLRAALGKDFEICLSDRDMNQLAHEGFEDESGAKGSDKRPKGTLKMIEKKQLLETIRLATVDNFQGEEAKIIIVSLVRSNQQRRVGFLRTENRINVLLSRAKNGMYLIGNSETYLNIPMWADVYNQLFQAGRVGNEIELRCPRHEETPLACSEPEDFALKSPEDLTAPATTVVRRSVMMEKLAAVAKHHVRSDVHTLLAHRLVTRHALHVSKAAPGLARTKALVPCLVRRQCPIGHCQACGGKDEERVDLLEFKSYYEVKLDESPIVVLGCGHFFTGETLDGLVGLDEVYTRDKVGNFNGLKDISSSLSRNVPFCPDCKRPIRQFATKRYNRLINRAVMDEICKRFLISGREILDYLEQGLQTIEEKLESTRGSHSVRDGVGVLPSKRYDELKKLRDAGRGLAKRMSEDHEPMKLLVDAITKSRSKATGDPLSVTRQIEAMKLSSPAPDNQIILGAQLVVIKSQEIQLQDAIAILKEWRGKTDGVMIQGWLKEQALPSMGKFLKTCENLIGVAKDASLPRTAVAATLAFARVSQLFTWRVQITEKTKTSQSEQRGFETVEERTNTGRELLKDALQQCSRVRDGEDLQNRIRAMMRLFEPQYNEVTPEELALIKSAMVSGSRGISTHSGHWYYCENNHPFAIGECGMPMEVARCPECGARIGGTHHEAVDGVTRARDME